MADMISHEAAAHAAHALPVMLPPKLVGRDTTLAQVYTHLKANKPVLVFGPAGIGKTALAATLASAYSELPGGVLWLIVNNSPLEELLVRVGRAYNVTEITSSDNPLAMIGAVASTLTQQKPLVVLDGELNEGVAEDFLTRCATNLPAILASQAEMDGPWAAVELLRLEPAHAVAMFNQLSGIQDQEGADALVAMLGHSPFAIAVAAGVARASKQAPAQLMKVFEQIPAAGSPTPDLLALTVSFRALNKALQGLILTLGSVFGGSASAELLSMISGAPQDTIEQVMKGLAQISLVERFERYGNPYYHLHDLTYTFAQTWLRGSNQLEALQTKVRDAVMAYIRKYSADNPDAHNRLAAEMDTLLAVARWSVEQGSRDIANQMVVALMQAGDFVSERGYLYELLQLRRLAASLTTAFPAYPAPPARVEEGEEAEAVGDRPASASLWDVVEEEGEESTEPSELLDEEEFEEEDEFLDEEIEEAEEESEGDPLRVRLMEARRQGDRNRQVEILKEIGQSQVDQKMENEAIATFTEALDIYEALQDQAGILETLDMVAALMVKNENSQAAVLHATRGIALAKELNDNETHMHLLTTLGDARQQLGESEEAERAYQQALEVARNTGDSQNEAMILLQLGFAQLDNGEPETAIETWEQALKLFRAQNKRDCEGRALGGLGTAYGELERWAEAVNFHTSALHIAREVKDKEEEALQLGNLGYASVRANQLGQAVLRYRQALHLAYETGDRENIVSTIVDLVRLLVESKRHLNIAELLIDDALKLEPADRDVNRLKERIANEKTLAQANGVQMLAVSGTAKDYAANAYMLLEE
jgi:tetratricopeptide (TPR) repeat protein/energy-coupling factor transporter ATP-binding protein EcfA2